ncbi:MAG: discoidin domain-containing protein [Cyclobacteriaceae bacterium]|nr:discoidin domain-containing protein [Cyclobacteriaceae bacterium SS2]
MITEIPIQTIDHKSQFKTLKVNVTSMRLRLILSTAIIVVTVSFPVWSQTNSFPTSGNVGIGTSAPIHLFEVNMEDNVDLCEGGTAYASSVYNANYLPEKAFDNEFDLSTDAWATETLYEPSESWIAYHFTSSVIVNKLRIHPRKNYTKVLFDDFTIEASNNSTDGSDGNWTVIESNMQTIDEFKWFEYDFVNNSAYEWYRIRGNAQHHSGALYYINVGEIEMYQPEVEFNNILVAKANGQVGIGTDDIPSEYKVGINGRMILEEVNVMLSTNWPDYVFEESYPLKSLEVLDAYISENRHLPGLPKAVDVRHEGINVGEMNAKLLEKIEELTLYLIEQNEMILELKKEVTQLKMINQK